MYEIEETFEKLMRWATNLSEFLATDKSNDWSEELRLKGSGAVDGVLASFRGS